MSKASAEVSVTRHMPGPWKIAYDDGSGPEYITAKGAPIVTLRWGCSCCKSTIDSFAELSAEEQANAHLIASSPMLADLLRAMQNSEMHIAPIRDWARTYEIDLGKASNSTVIAVAIRKALEKAEGRSQ